MKKIVTIGGGGGSFVVLSALRDCPGVELSAIVSMADNGRSSGMLRDQYGTLPPGDVRRALVALSESNDLLRKLFDYRFKDGGLYSHTVGNVFLAAIEKITGDFSSAVREASQLLNVKGEVIPVTLDDVHLNAKLKDGTVLRGETKIDIPRGNYRAHISKVWLEPKPRMNPGVKRALHSADLIILCPGDLFTSLIPNLLVSGVSKAIRASKAKKVYLINLMTKFGETHGFKAENFVETAEQHLGKGVLDYVIFNNKKPGARTLAIYRKEKAEFVEPPLANAFGKKPHLILTDLLDTGLLVRHSQHKLRKILLSLT